MCASTGFVAAPGENNNRHYLEMRCVPNCNIGVVRGCTILMLELIWVFYYFPPVHTTTWLWWILLLIGQSLSALQVDIFLCHVNWIQIILVANARFMMDPIEPKNGDKLQEGYRYINIIIQDLGYCSWQHNSLYTRDQNTMRNVLSPEQFFWRPQKVSCMVSMVQSTNWLVAHPPGSKPGPTSCRLWFRRFKTASGPPFDNQSLATWNPRTSFRR